MPEKSQSKEHHFQSAIFVPRQVKDESDLGLGATHLGFPFEIMRELSVSVYFSKIPGNGHFVRPAG
jgi:hypothetical protein